MIVERIFDKDLAHASWMIGCQRTKEALVIDPARDIDRYLECAAHYKLRITAVCETHIHADFLSGSAELATATGATCYLSQYGGDDWSYRWQENSEVLVEMVGDGDSFSIGNVTIKVMHTPGHTPEHICFVIHDVNTNEPIGIASGDFVFVGDLGRPDLLETSAGIKDTMEASAKSLYLSCKQFMGMDDYIQVWPSHGAGSACGKALSAIPQSTIGYEKRTSPPLQLIEDEVQFISYMLADQPEPPMYFARMKRLNRDGVQLLGNFPVVKELTTTEELLECANQSTVIDTRNWDDVRQGHLPNSIWSTADSNFHRFAGSFVDGSDKIVLIVEESQLDRAIRNSIRIGLDQLVGWAKPSLLEQLDTLVSMPEVNADELDSLPGISHLDVRKSSEFQNGAIDGAINIAHTRLIESLDELDRDQDWIVNCHGGTRSAATCMALKRLGFKVTNLSGGYSGWAKRQQASQIST